MYDLTIFGAVFHMVKGRYRISERRGGGVKITQLPEFIAFVHVFFPSL